MRKLATEVRVLYIYIYIYTSNRCLANLFLTILPVLKISFCLSAGPPPAKAIGAGTVTRPKAVYTHGRWFEKSYYRSKCIECSLSHPIPNLQSMTLQAPKAPPVRLGVTSGCPFLKKRFYIDQLHI